MSLTVNGGGTTRCRVYPFSLFLAAVVLLILLAPAMTASQEQRLEGLKQHKYTKGGKVEKHLNFPKIASGYRQ